MLFRSEAKLKQNQDLANRIEVEQEKKKTVETLQKADVLQRRYSVSSVSSVSSSVFRHFNNSR